MAEADDLTQLITVRDWLRFAVSRFNAAGLVYGHGTATALDEAAFLILHTLHLPIDQLEPWLDCRLLMSERQAVQQIIERRIATRKPAPYLTNQAWMQGHAFYVDERVIVPRSYIGELLAGDLEGDSAGAGERSIASWTCARVRAAWPSWRRCGSRMRKWMRAKYRPMPWPWPATTSRDYRPRRPHRAHSLRPVRRPRRPPVRSHPCPIRPTSTPRRSLPFRRNMRRSRNWRMRAVPTASISCAGFWPRRRNHLTPNGTLVVEIGRGRELLRSEFPQLAVSVAGYSGKRG